jgi:hypothetical protein
VDNAFGVRVCKRLSQFRDYLYSPLTGNWAIGQFLG